MKPSNMQTIDFIIRIFCGGAFWFIAFQIYLAVMDGKVKTRYGTYSRLSEPGYFWLVITLHSLILIVLIYTMIKGSKYATRKA